MNREAYVKAVAKRLACSKGRRDEFVRDLESDISDALAAGETWEQVERRMGDPLQVAAEFNEDLSASEIAAGKKRKRTKIIVIVLAVVVVLAAILAAATWWATPHQADAGQSIGMTEQEIIAQAQDAAEIIAEGDYGSLRPMIEDAASEELSEPVMADAHALFGDDWGSLESYGNTYATQITQMGQTVNIVEMVAMYENTTVTYTIVFDESMKIVGLNMR